MTVEAFAPAKINLTLHVTARRTDGLHNLDSLVVFADIGDRIRADRAKKPSLTIDGRYETGVPTDSSNLATKAAALFGPGHPTTLRLTKSLPVASGIGGGSADAAATLRAMAGLWDVPVPDNDAVGRLGSDVPVCLWGRPARMTGAGASLIGFQLPQVFMVLVNPGVPLATPAVFSGLETRNNPPMPAELPHWPDAPAFCEWLAEQRNDLQECAIALAPDIELVLDEIRATPGCLLERMSGSGATCFGLFKHQKDAARAARIIASRQPDWWVVSAGLQPPLS